VPVSVEAETPQVEFRHVTNLVAKQGWGLDGPQTARTATGRHPKARWSQAGIG